MGWLLRISLPNRSESEEELLASTLWDLKTTGLFQNGAGETVAGFASEQQARSAGDALVAHPRHDVTVTGIEPAPTAEQWAPSAEAKPVTLNLDGRQVELAIVAGGAFGHGGHPTTRLSLDLMLQQVKPGDLVLDVGTGTGVLAIAAAVAGAGVVVGLDNDPDAIVVAEQNVRENHELFNTSVSVGDWTVAEALARLGGRPDLVVINVLLPVHRELAAEVLAAMAPGAALVTAGYLKDQVAQLISCYCRPTSVHAEAEQDGWVGHLLLR